VGQDSTTAAVLAGLAALLAPVLALIAFLALIVTLLAPSTKAACTSAATPPAVTGEGGEWVATAYGPPWGGIQGEGITATGINLQHDPHDYIIAVDPSVIHLGTYWHVVPNPWGNPKLTFLAGDTGGAILGKHIDIYDWEGRTAQNAWGARHVTLTPATGNGTAGVLEAAPTSTAGAGGGAGETAGCSGEPEGPLPLTAAQTAKVLPDGLAAAPREAPQAVKDMIAAGNRLHSAIYEYGAGHGPPLSTLQPAYDCSSAVSYVLHAGGVFGDYARVSGELEQYGEAGPGKWVTVYANSEHAFMYVAGVRFDTSWRGTDDGPNEGENGPRWRVYPEVPKWATWVVRHPPGM
jgi:3D (Asp-Asp-Asp) domain-containing protein